VRWQTSLRHYPRRRKFDFTRDIVPIASIDRTPDVMEVNPSFPAKTVPEFIAYAKANPGKINMATTGSEVGHIFTCRRFQELNSCVP
jgi:tripartite-type tricarboxylate transporter receptor subunit TctC